MGARESGLSLLVASYNMYYVNYARVKTVEKSTSPPWQNVLTVLPDWACTTACRRARERLEPISGATDADLRRPARMLPSHLDTSYGELLGKKSTLPVAR